MSEKKFTAHCSMCGSIIETDDIAKGEAAVERHKEMHDQLYRENQLELALAAPNPEGALRFFGLVR